MTRESLRDKFNSRFKYSGISEQDIARLIKYVEEELSEYASTEIGRQIKMTLSKVRVRDKKFKNGGVQKFFLMVDGSYFKRREAISFNDGGFIGFAGWADRYNVQPFLKAFDNWMELELLEE